MCEYQGKVYKIVRDKSGIYIYRDDDSISLFKENTIVLNKFINGDYLCEVMIENVNPKLYREPENCLPEFAEILEKYNALIESVSK